MIPLTEESNVYTIYYLSNPLTGEPFYVGKTSKPLHVRLAGHMSEKGNRKKVQVIQAIRSKGLKPTIHVLQICIGHHKAYQKEIQWILKLNKEGTLTNMVMCSKKKPSC